MWNLLSLRASTLLAGMTLAAGATVAVAADLPSRKMEPAPLMTQLPAVDGINAKLEVFGGLTQRLSQDPTAPFFQRNQWRPASGLLGSVTFPVGNSFGLQLDGGIATGGGVFSAALGGHAFWRDPSKALFGVYASGTRYSRAGGIVVGRVAPEAEIYLGRVTLQGVAGVEFGSNKGYTYGYPWFVPGTTFLTLNQNAVRTRFFDIASIAFYPVDDLKLAVGQRYVFGKLAAAASAEYLVTHGPTAVSVFAEGRLGQRGASAVFGGLKVYFGQRDKSLIRRHREDDPINHHMDTATSGGGYGNSGGSGLPIVTCAPTPDMGVGSTGAFVAGCGAL